MVRKRMKIKKLRVIKPVKTEYYVVHLGRILNTSYSYSKAKKYAEEYLRRHPEITGVEIYKSMCIVAWK